MCFESKNEAHNPMYVRLILRAKDTLWSIENNLEIEGSGPIGTETQVALK